MCSVRQFHVGDFRPGVSVGSVGNNVFMPLKYVLSPSDVCKGYGTIVMCCYRKSVLWTVTDVFLTSCCVVPCLPKAAVVYS